MTTEVAKKIVRGITDKIECNTADIDDWAEFWGFTVDEYEEFLDMAIKALEQEPRTGHWIEHEQNGIAHIECSECLTWFLRCHLLRNSFCPICGAKMVDPQESEDKK